MCRHTHRCVCVTVWWEQMMHIPPSQPVLSKDSLFSLNQCFQSGHYHFTISSIIINNSAFFYKVFLHAHTDSHSHTLLHTNTVYLVYWILSFPGLRCDLVYSLILIIPCVFNGIIVINFLWHTQAFIFIHVRISSANELIIVDYK